jgi:hypothetical protein
LNGDFVLLGAEGPGSETSAVDPRDAGAIVVSISSLPGDATEPGNLGGSTFALASAVWLVFSRIESLPGGMMPFGGERGGRAARIAR